MSKRIDTTECHCLKLRRSAENITDFYNAMISPAGVKIGQLFLLDGIARNPGCSIRVLSDVTGLDRSTLARSLKPLLKAGLIFDQKEAGSRNCMLILTDRGEQIYVQGKELWEDAQRTLEKHIGAQTLTMLESTLRQLEDL